MIECCQTCISFDSDKNLSLNVDVRGNNISIIGSGTVIVSANVTNYGKLYIQGTDFNNICTVRCIDGGALRIRLYI